MQVDPIQELRGQGLKPMDWQEVLAAVKARLTPPDWEKFQRLHRNFVGYATPATLMRFYDFVFAHDLQLELNAFRFRRLERVLAALAAHPIAPGARLLEVGAGAGFVADAARKFFSPREYVVADLCAEVRAHLSRRGYPVLPIPAPGDGVARAEDAAAHPPGGTFDVILCVDALGEIHSDDDGWLNGDNAGQPEFSAILEERYGYAQKLEAWKPYLAASGSLLLWEPLRQRAIWEGLAQALRAEGWHAHLDESVAGGEYLKLSLP